MEDVARVLRRMAEVHFRKGQNGDGSSHPRCAPHRSTLPRYSSMIGGSVGNDWLGMPRVPARPARQDLVGLVRDNVAA